MCVYYVRYIMSINKILNSYYSSKLLCIFCLLALILVVAACNGVET